MPIVEETIKDSVKQLLANTATLPPDEAQEAFASQLASVIVAALKSATVIMEPGSIQVVGSPSAQSNAVPATGSLS